MSRGFDDSREHGSPLQQEVRTIDKHNIHDVRLSEKIIKPLAHVNQLRQRMSNDFDREENIPHLEKIALEGFQEGLGNLGFDRNDLIKTPEDMAEYIDVDTLDDMTVYTEMHGDKIVAIKAIHDPAKMEDAYLALVQTENGEHLTHVFDGERELPSVH